MVPEPSLWPWVLSTWLPPSLQWDFQELPCAGAVPPTSLSSKLPLPAPAHPKEEKTQRQLQLSELAFFSRGDGCSPVKAAAMFLSWKGLFMKRDKKDECCAKRWTLVAGMNSVRCLLFVSPGGDMVPFQFLLLLGLFQHPEAQRGETWNFSENQRFLETWS